jgi:hypothetical protein
MRNHHGGRGGGHTGKISGGSNIGQNEIHSRGEDNAKEEEEDCVI